MGQLFANEVDAGEEVCVYGPSHGLSYGPGIQTHVSNRKKWFHFYITRFRHSRYS